MRILAISDIHGCHDELVELLNKVNYDSNKDKLILLGDYVDRGKDPMKTLLLVGDLMDKGAIVLEGNHDNMFKQLIKEERLFTALADRYYMKLGTDITVKDYYRLSTEKKERIKEILDKLIPYYEYNDYIFVHAGVNSNLSVDKNDPYDLIWLRDEFYDNAAYSNKKVIFGHTVTCYLHDDHRTINIWYDDIHKDKIGIDCGCVYGGKLACLDLTNMIEYYV